MVTNDGKLIVICIRNTGLEAVDAGALDIIDAKSLEKVKSIPVRRGLHDVALTADGKFAAAGSPGGQFITVFDLQKMEIAWEVNYDQGVLPVIIESNPDGSGHRIFAQLNQDERIFGGGFCDAQGSGSNKKSRRAQWIPSRVRGHQPRHRHSPGQ